MQLGNLELADLTGDCTLCGARQPVDWQGLVARYGRGAELGSLPPQPCLFCKGEGVTVWVQD